MKKQNFLLIFLVLSTFLCSSVTAQNTDVPSGKFSGIIFGDYFYNVDRDAGIATLPNSSSKGDKDSHGLSLRRVTLIYNYQFSSKFSSRVRLESDEGSYTTNSSDKSNKLGMFIYDAFFKWNFIGKHDLIVGVQSTPAYEVSERVWGHRFLEKTIMDARGIVPSRDLAISLKGNIDSKGILKYWLMYGNSNAYKPETDKYKRIYALLELTPIQNLSITAYSDYQTKSEIVNPYIASQMLNNDILTSAIFVGYKVKDKFTAGFEAYTTNTSYGYNNSSSLVDKSGNGYSVFGTYNFNPKLALVGRYDSFEPNSINSGDKRSWIIGALTYKPVKNLTLSPNIISELYEKNPTAITNSITARLSFNWSF